MAITSLQESSIHSFNFEMVYDIYHQFVKGIQSSGGWTKSSHLQLVNQSGGESTRGLVFKKGVAMKGWDHLVDLELIGLESFGSGKGGLREFK